MGFEFNSKGKNTYMNMILFQVFNEELKCCN